MRAAVRAITAFLQREPVMLGAAAYATFEAAAPGASAAWKLAGGFWVAWMQRSFSRSKAHFDEQLAEAREAGQNEAVAVIAAAKKPRATAARGAIKKGPKR